MRRFEVATRMRARPVIPGGLCCACGRESGPGVYWSGHRLRSLIPEKDLPLFEFPLCHACGTAKAARDRVFYGALGGTTAALFAAYLLGALPGDAMTRVQAVLFLLGLGVMGGAVVGWTVAWLAGLVFPTVREGNRVAAAARWSWEGWATGRRLDDLRCFFRFTNEAYARAFADANAGILLPGRGRHAFPAPAAASAAGIDAPHRE